MSLASPHSLYRSYFQTISDIGYSSFPLLLHFFVHALLSPQLNVLVNLFVSVWCLRSSLWAWL